MKTNKNLLQKRTTKNQSAILERLKTMPVVEIACKKAGISRATYYRWREDKDFAKQSDEALDEGKQFINEMAESQLINQIRNAHMTALIFWLKHHHVDYRTRVEISTAPKDKDNLSKEQEELVNQSLLLAGLLQERSNDESEKSE